MHMCLVMQFLNGVEKDSDLDGRFFHSLHVVMSPCRCCAFALTSVHFVVAHLFIWVHRAASLITKTTNSANELTTRVFRATQAMKAEQTHLMGQIKLLTVENARLKVNLGDSQRLCELTREQQRMGEEDAEALRARFRRFVVSQKSKKPLEKALITIANQRTLIEHLEDELAVCLPV
jgi:hypothetical protein